MNGSIFCKVCGEFLFLEEFSTLESFSDDTIVNTKEELISDVQARMLSLNKQGKSPDLTFNGTGQVYGLRNASDFEGVFGQTRSGYVVGEKGKGKLWLENNNGVVLALTPERKGLALSLGADGVVVKLK